MPFRFTPKIIIKGYFFLFFLICVSYLTSLFNPASIQYSFYQILITFNASYLIRFLLCVTSALFNAISLIPLFLFIYNKQFLAPKFWQKLLTLRLIFDLTGHLYEYYTLKSLFHYEDPSLGFYTTLLLVIMLLPSYIIHYQYAYRLSTLKKIEVHK